MTHRRWIVLNITVAVLLFALFMASLHAPPLAFYANCKPVPVEAIAP
ncbi:MAG: hypothetical protein SGJ24_04550 [Chloroflexota bacterium]|nr:hypothetical protein [Chloroflexota bacterium]